MFSNCFHFFITYNDSKSTTISTADVVMVMMTAAMFRQASYGSCLACFVILLALLIYQTEVAYGQHLIHPSNSPSRKSNPQIYNIVTVCIVIFSSKQCREMESICNT